MSTTREIDGVRMEDIMNIPSEDFKITHDQAFGNGHTTIYSFENPESGDALELICNFYTADVSPNSKFDKFFGIEKHLRRIIVDIHGPYQGNFVHLRRERREICNRDGVLKDSSEEGEKWLEDLAKKVGFHYWCFS